VTRNWFHSPAHDSGRSLAIVRVVVALILATHALHGLMHPGYIRGFGHFLESRGFPIGAGMAWTVMFLQIGCSLALVARRFVVPACIGHIFVLGMGIWLVHTPRWRTVGLPDGDHQPGAEFSLLMIACLVGVLWGHWRSAEGSSPNDPPSRRGFAIVRIAAALILMIHPIGGLRDPAGLNDLGVYFGSIGFPLGIPLVWGAMFLQIASSVAIVFQRFVVLACLGHTLVLSTGVWLFHAPNWFVVGPANIVGPGKEGMEYSVLLMSCFFSVLLAYWPLRLGRAEQRRGRSRQRGRGSQLRPSLPG
jgi:putative oxidoreductase